MKLKLDEIKKTYEDVYTSNRVLSWCKLPKVSNDIGVDEKEYRSMMRNIFKKQQEIMFDFLLKYYWLSKKFCYNGRLKGKFKGNGWTLDRAFGVYMKCHVGYNNCLISQSNYKKVFSYIDDFFPDLMAENPFKKKMKYPYVYMNFECLSLVSDIPERLELLTYGEKHRMRFSKFVDFVFNYVCTVNEHSDNQVFNIDVSYNNANPYVRYNSTKIKTSDIRQGFSQLSSSKPFSTESPVKGFGDNFRPA